MLEQIVVVEDDPVVDPDDRAVPYRMVVRRDRRMALRVVPHMYERLRRGCRNADAFQELARAGLLLVHRDLGVAGIAIRVSDRIRAPLRDSGQERLRTKRPVDARLRAEAVSGDPAHV